MSRRLSRSAALVTAILALVACAPADDNANGGLANTAWTVVSIAATPTLADARPHIAFAPEGTLTGTDGCNQISATFHTDGNTIQISQTSSTMMACEPAVMAQAQAFTAALSGATEWRQTETGDLELRGHGDILATPGVAAPPSGPPVAGVDLADTAWVLVDLDGSVGFDAALAPTLEFGIDGTLSGFAGCNSYDGPYTMDLTTIDIGPLASTKMACAGPAAGIEGAYLPALDAVGTWQVLATGQLVLNGPAVLTYQPG